VGLFWRDHCSATWHIHPCTPFVCLHESGSELYKLFRNRSSYSFEHHVNFAKWPVRVCFQLLFVCVWIIQVARRVVVAYAFPFNANISPTSHLKHVEKHCLIENVLHLTYEAAFVNVPSYCATYSATYCNGNSITLGFHVNVPSYCAVYSATCCNGNSITLGFHAVMHWFCVLRRSRSITLRRLMSYIYGAPILDVSRSHTTTQHSR